MFSFFNFLIIVLILFSFDISQTKYKNLLLGNSFKILPYCLALFFISISITLNPTSARDDACSGPSNPAPPVIKQYLFLYMVIKVFHG